MVRSILVPLGYTIRFEGEGKDKVEVYRGDVLIETKRNMER